MSSGAAATSVNNASVSHPFLVRKGTEWGVRERERERLTLGGEVLTWRDGADAGEGDSQDGRGIKSREEVWDELCIGKMGFDSSDLQGSAVGSLGINEGTQERKSDSGGEKKHGGGVRCDSDGRLFIFNGSVHSTAAGVTT